MTTDSKAAQTANVGCYDQKGPDFDTALIGPVTSTIIDADRLVRMEWKNGFPNWMMYRTVLAGDSLYTARLRLWAVAFAIAYCGTGGIKRHAYSDELAAVAAWDALYMLMTNRMPEEPAYKTAEAMGVDPKTYKRLRNHLFGSMKGSLDEYWIRLGAAYRYAFLAERKS